RAVVERDHRDGRQPDGAQVRDRRGARRRGRRRFRRGDGFGAHARTRFFFSFFFFRFSEAGFFLPRGEPGGAVGRAHPGRSVVAFGGQADQLRGAARGGLFGRRAFREAGFFGEAEAAFAVRAARDVVQQPGRVALRFVERLRGVGAGVRAAREGEHGGDDRRGEGGAAVGAPVRQRLFFFAFQVPGFAGFAGFVGVADHHARVRVGVGGHVGDRAKRPASDRAPVRDRLLPGGRAELHAAAAAARARAVPDRLAGPAAAEAERREPRAADRDDRRRGGRERGPGRFAEFVVPVAVAAVARGGGDDGPRVGVGQVRGGGCQEGFLRRAPRVRDLPGAEFLGSRDGFGQVGEFLGVRLDEQDLAALAGRVGGLDVERDLDAPADRFFGFFFGRFDAGFEGFFEFFRGFRERQRAARALRDLFEAAVFGRAGGQAEFFAVRLQVGFGRGVVVGVDQRDRLFGGRRRGQRVGAVQILRAQPELAGFRGGNRRARFGGAPDHADRVGVAPGFAADRHELQREAGGAAGARRRARGPDRVVRSRQRRDRFRARGGGHGRDQRGREGEAEECSRRSAHTAVVLMLRSRKAIA